MGDPRRLRKQYEKPPHPWMAARIAEEKELMKEFGLRRKKEIWKAESILRRFRAQAKKLIAARGEQEKKEGELLLRKLIRLGLLHEGAKVEDVLDLNVRDILNRRLQSVVFKKGLALSMKQARQFIVHKHIMVGDKKVNVPSYLVEKNEEDKICFAPDSPFSKEDHVEISKLKKTEQKVEEVKQEG
ncbi:30S ribosomal protein S4 [Candidatus Woesearchaeota archaeon]|nr:30S ribosomal protein S4 [Candidatus Woesearchaeota archaeon]RLE40365.1 MAG: 30S ribosomal protein S4 [Candidatus Woesearchaeota archaeon]